MANINTLRGGREVMANLNKEILLIKGRSLKGLILGAAIVRKDMEKTSPKTPVDYGNLKASFFTVTARSVRVGRNPKFKSEVASKMSSDHSSTISEIQGMVKAQSTGGNIMLMLGYSANYATAVHELLDMNLKPRWRYGPGPGKKRWYRPRVGAGPKWFEYSLKRNSKKILQAIAVNAQIKG